ncbi:MAG: helix-turn-helix domain-containing protein [Pyrinomonadaceae bacterium]
MDGFEHDGKAIADPNGEFDVSLEFSDLLDGVFDGLPEERKRAFALLEEGFPIESKHGEIATVSKMVGRSSRTIRNWVREAWEQYNDGARGRSL